MSSDSIKLIISKVMDPEELDARFSRFTRDPSGDRRSNGWLGKLASVLLEGAEDFMNQQGSSRGGDGKVLSRETAPKGVDSSKSAKPATTEKIATDTKSPARVSSGSVFRAFAFDDLDLVINASKAACAFNGDSILYKRPRTNSYVLIIRGQSPSDDAFVRACNSIAEYGRMLRVSQHTDTYFEEHYIPIVAEGAINKLSRI